VVGSVAVVVVVVEGVGDIDLEGDFVGDFVVLVLVVLLGVVVVEG